MIFLQRTFTSLVHAHAGRTQGVARGLDTVVAVFAKRKSGKNNANLLAGERGVSSQKGIRMDIVLIILNILVLVGIAVLGLLGKNYFSKYVSEKAKNLATKEDIADITDKIESVKSSYAHSLEKAKSEYQIKSALQQAFQSKCLEALVEVNDLLADIHLYCWKQIAERSPNEHYVWANVDDTYENKHFHYYRVAIDKITMMYGLYLTNKAKKSMHDLANQIGLLSSMEHALSGCEVDSAIEDSAVTSYETGIKAVEKCRTELTCELGITNES